MSADKMNTKLYAAIGEALNAIALPEAERRRVVIALCDAVREDEREKAVARFLSMGPWTEESGAGIVEAIRNA